MTLALDLPVLAPAAPALRAARPVLRVLPAPPSAPPYDDRVTTAAPLHLVADPAPLPEPEPYDETHWYAEDLTPTAELPPARPHVGLLVQALVEVYAGARPLNQLRRELGMDLYAEVAGRLQDGRRLPGGRPEPRCVLSVHTQERAEGIVEACATVRRRSGRFHAVALRLEGFGGRWVCTVLEGM
jgi:hypothetical protein